jgi:hypothetical protein
MKAYVKPRIGVRFSILRAKLIPPFRPSPETITVELWGRNLKKIIHEKIPLKIEKQAGKPRLVPVDKNVKRNNVKFVDAIHITAFAGRGTIVGKSWFHGKHSPQKAILNLNEIVSNSGMTSYTGKMKIMNRLEISYKLDQIEHY